MKKIVIILLALAPMVTMAQDIKKANSKTKSKTSKTDTRTKDKTEKTVEGKETAPQNSTELRNNAFLYVEVGVANSSSGSMIKLHLGDYKSIIRDKALVAGLEEARAKRYNSVAGVLNQLDQLGFEVLTSYESFTRAGSESRIVLRAENRQPNVALPQRGDGNTLSKENPAMRNK